MPGHLEEVRRRKEELADKTIAAVKERLTAEINYWDHRAEQLKEQELAGKTNFRLNSGLARHTPMTSPHGCRSVWPSSTRRPT